MLRRSSAAVGGRRRTMSKVRLPQTAVRAAEAHKAISAGCSSSRVRRGMVGAGCLARRRCFGSGEASSRWRSCVGVGRGATKLRA